MNTTDLLEDYRRIVVETLRGHERTAHNATTQNLFYEDSVKEFVRENVSSTLGVIRGEVRDGQFGSGDCDIIVYEGQPIYLSRSGVVGIISSRGARAMIEVDDKASDVSNKFKRGIYDRFRKFSPKLLIVALTGVLNYEYYKKWYGVDVFILSDNQLHENPLESTRLIAALNTI